ncbi:unnamed protein product [Mytilus coruscus]|uniref:Uncharacterized protein n=1 Tax=Mytilus coruscus TaxID=42192 RepID=A0A6J8CR41_MYTCO|nr:unnamed protein product [Mytilus coruscus]
MSSRKKGFPKKRKELNLVFDWSGVSFVTEQPTYSQTGNPHFESNVIFRSVFENQSASPQTHSLKAERQTVAECKSTLSKGYTTSLNMGLEIGAPEEIAKASIGYSRGYEVVNGRETTNQKTLTWASEGTLTVPEHSNLTAEIHIKEKQCGYTFKTRVAIRGTVVVNFYSRRDNNKYLMVFTGDMKEVLLDDKTIPDLKTEGRTVFIDIEGSCDFKFGIEQQIVIS